MGKNSKPGSSVCKFLYDDECSPIFQIPSRLVKSYGDELPQTATLRINHSEKCWRVSIEKFKGQHFFTDGWKEFAEEVDMKTREYLLFKAAGLSEFHISPDKSDDDTELNSGDQTENSEDGDFTFTTELKSYHKERLGLPKKFTNLARIKKDSKLILKDVEGRQWPVRLTGRSAGRYALTAGWLDFLIANKVIVGSLVSFKFVSGSNNTIEARVIKEGSNKKALFNFVKRKRDQFEVFEPDKTSDLASGPENLHTMSEHGEGPGNSRKTSGHGEGPEKSHLNVKSENEDHFPEEENNFGVERRWKFSKELKKHNAYKLDIPRDISKVIEKVTKGEIELQDCKGRKWPIRLEYRKCGAYTMTSGWIDFLVENKVYIGSTISFEFIPSSDSNVIEARVIENGEKGSELFVKRAKGRPPEYLHTSSEYGEGPESSHETSGHTEGLENWRKTSGHAEGPEKSHLNVKSENEDRFAEKEKRFGIERTWKFSKVLKKHNAYKLDIPRDLSKVIEKTTNGEIKLQDCKVRKWPVHLEYRECGAYTITSGWFDFLVGNKVYVGSTISFEFIPSSDNNVIEARVIENGEKETELFVKKPKGRPPCQ